MKIESMNSRRSIACPSSSLFTCELPHGISSLHLFISTFFFVCSPVLPISDALLETNSNNVDGSLNPTLAILLVIFLVFFFTGLLLLYISCCTDSPTHGGIVLPIVVARDGRGGHALGLDKSVIDGFPTFVYSAVTELKMGKGSLECAVCLSEFEDQETLRLLPKCNHIFHPDCINAWLAAHITCPLCRANVLSNSDGKELATGNESTQNRESDELATEDEIPQNQVQITVNEGQSREFEIAKGREMSNGRFPRSHSTGHSLIQPGQDCERFTLTLPEEVRKHLMLGAKLKRTASFVALPPV
ncbi:hypothetical protein Nepgr_016497 [Nepenthes gracilis]|uniref:RING-type E3 ubiquitin transferase n=1 Tax=Nepenthes gracilis TaxID=150966 RepID=A0AAD3XSD7_NEPGR|nr:hypothetical protein Nepgr_016497 [Nepenthes gracilis]